MKLKLTGDVVANWIQSTMDEIKELLRKYEIPFEDSWIKGDRQLGGVDALQLVFPWCEGDVVVGMLHPFDDVVVRGIADFTYPSIETYCFPFDNGDITVFKTPEDFVKKLNEFYETQKEEK